MKKLLLSFLFAGLCSIALAQDKNFTPPLHYYYYGNFAGYYQTNYAIYNSIALEGNIQDVVKFMIVLNKKNPIIFKNKTIFLNERKTRVFIYLIYVVDI